MNEETREYLELVETARREATAAFSGRVLRNYGPDDLAQDAVMAFCQRKIAKPEEKVENPKALLKRMVHNLFLNTVKKVERQKRLDEQRPPPPKNRSPIEELEDRETAREVLLRLKVQNDIQHEIIAHALRGLDVWRDREDILWCLCVTSKKLTKETHNLKKAEVGESVIEFAPMCDCAVLREFRLNTRSLQQWVEDLERSAAYGLESPEAKRELQRAIEDGDRWSRLRRVLTQRGMVKEGQCLIQVHPGLLVFDTSAIPKRAMAPDPEVDAYLEGLFDEADREREEKMKSMKSGN